MNDKPDYEAAALALGYQQIPCGTWFHPNQHPNFTERFKSAEQIFERYFGEHWPSTSVAVPIPKDILYTILSNHIPSEMIDSIWQELSEALERNNNADNLTPKNFVDDIISACDPSNWDAERHQGDYFAGLKDAYDNIHEIAVEYQTAMYRISKP